MSKRVVRLSSQYFKRVFKNVQSLFAFFRTLLKNFIKNLKVMDGISNIYATNGQWL
jgi:hypothetical protein